MTKAKNGDTVKVHYTGKFEDGQVFDSSEGRDPLQFTIGQRQVIPGFEEAVDGMNPGESITAKIPADKAYGTHHEEMVMAVDRKKIPENVDPKVGQQLQLHQADGRKIRVTVTNVSESKVTLDANHPLAGKDLTFDIKLVEIV
ncbi:MAG: peptidylprolyl isomerase [Candidatus Zixiibacteriota bacterium]